MAQVESVNWISKRIYLHIDTVTNGFNIIEAYFEISDLRALNANGEQNHPHALSAEGRFPKDNVDPNLATKFTPRFGFLEIGWRLVPHDSNHDLDLLVEIVSKDGLSDRDTFDRSLLSAGISVNIDPVYDAVELREIQTGSGVTNQDKQDIAEEVWSYERA